MQKDKKTYRASFQGLKPRADQMAITIATEITVEVFAQTKDRWAARYFPSAGAMKGISAASREGAQAQVENAFTTQKEPWSAFNPDGSGYVEESEATEEAPQ